MTNKILDRHQRHKEKVKKFVSLLKIFLSFRVLVRLRSLFLYLSLHSLIMLEGRGGGGVTFSCRRSLQHIPLTLRTCFLLKLFLLLAALTAAVEEQRAAAALFILIDTLNPAYHKVINL